MTRLPAILRGIVLALLVLALALPSLWRPASVAGRVVRIRAASDLDKSGLLAGSAPAATVYESATPPTPTELETLAAAAGRAPLFGVLPATARTVDASATARPLAAGEAAALVEWAARGGGVLLAGDRSGAPGFGLVRAGSRAAPVDGGAIRWALPPELAPLPGDRVAAAAQPFEAAFAGSFAGASSPAGGLLALRPLGRGRAAALAITETWRWRMEAGRVAEHREFWRSLVDWLSSARPEPLAIQLADASGPVGVRREVRVFDARERTADPIPPLVLTRPDGPPDTLRLSRDAASPGVLRAWFVPAAEGVHTFAFAGQPPRAAFRATSTPAASADAWARLAFVATRSGGRMLPPDSVRATLSRLGPASSGGWRGPSPWLLFIALLLVASAEWAIRRLTGRE